jgi:hypothetical protein
MTADALLRVPEPGNLRAAIVSVDWTLSRTESAVCRRAHGATPVDAVTAGDDHSC